MEFPAHFNLAQLPTPIVPVKNFFDEISGYRVWIKRDDLTGLELSGNKVRKLDFLVREAVEQGVERLITCGGVQSNHCRATVYYARRLGLKTTLFLRGEKPAAPTGNYLLDLLAGADIHLITPEQYRDVERLMAQERSRSPEKAYVIPEGGSNETGAWGYVKGFYEILEQVREQNLPIDTIVVATGSGGTHAGLLLGKLLSGSSLNVVSVNVCDDAPFFKRKISAIMKAFGEKYGHRITWSERDIHIVDGYVGGGYGVISTKEGELIRRLAEREGLVIDPVYGAKAFRGLEEKLKAGEFPGKNILFIHTGGVFGVFPYGDRL